MVVPPISNPHQVCLTVGSTLKLGETEQFLDRTRLASSNSFLLLEEFYPTTLLGDAPHVGQPSVEVAGRYAEDAADPDEHEQSLKDVRDEDSLDAAHRGVESANHPY